MKIAYITECFTDGLGYIDNVLPREFGRLGHESHLITTCLPHYYTLKEGGIEPPVETAQDAMGDAHVGQRDGFSLHKVPVRLVGGRAVLLGLGSLLSAIRPDVILCRGAASWVAGQVARYRARNRCVVVGSSGQTRSGYPAYLREETFNPLARLVYYITHSIPARLYCGMFDAYVGSTDDCSQALIDFLKLPLAKIRTIPLGVDLDLFHPVENETDQEERRGLRSALGITDDEIVCIWTGRLASGKLAYLVAEAATDLRAAGHSYRAIFVGKGSEEGRIRSFKDSVLVPFTSWQELPRYYRAADIAVWPRLITTSTLDAAACGLPVVMSDTELAVERWEGNGLTYREGNLESLKEVLLQLKDPKYRKALGERGTNKMRELYGWKRIAEEFLNLFEELAAHSALSVGK